MNWNSDIDDEFDNVVACPHCREEIYDDVDQCPYCRQYLSSADLKKRMPTWVIVLVVLTIVSLLMPTFFVVLRSISGQ